MDNIAEKKDPYLQLVSKDSSKQDPIQNVEIFRLLVESVKDYGIFVLDPQGYVRSWNLGAERIKGYRAEEILGVHFSRFYPIEDINAGKPAMELEVATREGKFEDLGWRIRKDGSLFWANVVITALRDRSGKLVGFGKVTRDLTERKQVEEALRASEERFRLMVDSVKDYAILSLDPEGRITTWNQGSQRLKGYTSKEIIGKHFSVFYPKEDIEAGKPDQELIVANEQGSFEDEGWRIKKDGSRFWASVVITAMRDSNGVLRGFSKVTRDLTVRKQYEEELKKKGVALSAANKELEAFSYAVSHDLRSPLRGIDGFSQALLEDYGDKLDDLGKQYLRFIREGTQKMGKLIDDLLNLARLTRANMSMVEVDLSRIAKTITQNLQNQDPRRNARVNIQDGIVVKGDPGLLTVVLENLLNNAWKFTAKKAETFIEFGVKEEKDRSVYFVRDNGAGFDMKYYGKLFGAFHRLHPDTDFKGTGVGLATVRRIITRHNGEVWAESKVGEGTTFYFTL
jgi:PAS domain S-box-containing protein